MIAVEEAIILVGGKGTRLRSITKNEIPKALAPIQEKPIICWELEWLIREGVSKAILATGHLSDLIEEELGDKYHCNFGSIEIEYSVEKEKLGSGGAIKLASRKVCSSHVFVMNGDILTNARLKPMIEHHEKMGVKATMMGVNMVSPYGVIHTNNGLIEKFEEKPRLNVPIHAGVDLFETSVLSRFPEKGQMEETIFVELVQEKQFALHLLSNDIFWMSVDTQKDFDTANNIWCGLL